MVQVNDQDGIIGWKIAYSGASSISFQQIIGVDSIITLNFEQDLPCWLVMKKMVKSFHCQFWIRTYCEGSKSWQV